MSSFTNLLVIAFLIHLSLVVLGVATIPGTDLYNFLINPSTWDASPFSLLIGGLIGAAALSVIIIGTIFLKTDFLIFAGLAAVYYSFGKGLANLHGIISAQISPTFAWFTISPIIIIYISVLLSWWRRG